MKTDRDLSIERLLSRSLRAQGPPSGGCPDVEALAALADDALPANERRVVEVHVADCDRCQALTAVMVRTTPATSEGAGDRRAASPWWKSRPTLNWLVPATAAATALALWVAVPGQRSPALEERQPELQAAATPPPELKDAPAGGNAEGFRSAVGPRADNQARDNEARAAVDSTLSTDAKPAAPAEGLLKLEENRLERQGGVASEEVRVTPELDRSLLDQTAPLAAARAAAPTAAGFEVVSSDPQVRWRAGSAQVIVQYSADGGATWTTQETGATAPLTAGSSPSPSVCWLVGRSGTVLRSTDGGRQWQRVAFPEASDLIAVRASSALAATVDLAGGRRLSTADSGQTWTEVAK